MKIPSWLFLLLSASCLGSCRGDSIPEKEDESVQSEREVDADELFAASRVEAMKDPQGSYEKLLLAAANGHFLAARELSHSIWREDVDFKKYGRDAVDAKINILKNAIRNNDRIYQSNKEDTDLILAGLYNKDDSLAYDPRKARSIYRRLSENMDVDAWEEYASMCFAGDGGERDLNEAYFYYSAICAISDFDSFDAKNAWEMRNKIVQKIDPRNALKVLNRLEKWFADNEIPSAKYTKYTQGDSKIEEAVRIQKEREDAHVKALKSMVREK